MVPFRKLITLILIAGYTTAIKAAEDDLYDFLWLDPDKKVYVLQNKLYKKQGTFYADAGFLIGLTSTYQDVMGGHLKAGYYLGEEWSLELFYNMYSNSDNDDVKILRAINEKTPFIRRLNSSYGAMVNWAPFYGKLNVFNGIYYFDWSFGAGVGQISAESNVEGVVADTSGAQSDQFKAESLTAGFLKTSVRFYINRNWHVSVEYLNSHFLASFPVRAEDTSTPTIEKEIAEGEHSQVSDIIFSVGYSF